MDTEYDDTVVNQFLITSAVATQGGPWAAARDVATFLTNRNHHGDERTNDRTNLLGAAIFETGAETARLTTGLVTDGVVAAATVLHDSCHCDDEFTECPARDHWMNLARRALRAAVKEVT